MLVFFFIMLALFGAFFTFVGIKGFITCRRARSWPAVEGKVVRSEVVREKTQAGDSVRWFYVPKVTYEYEVDGARYESDQIAFVESHDVTPDQAQATVAQFPVGETVEAYYDPADPGEATLDRSGTGTAIALMCVSPLVSAGGVLGAVMAWPKK